MMLAVAGPVGLFGGLLLWEIARRAAVRRDVALGAPPIVYLAACTVIALVAHDHPAAATVATGVLAAGVVAARTGYIFHDLTLAVFVATCIAALIERILPSALAASAALGFGLYGIFASYQYLRKRAGMGIADVRVVACMGLGLGFTHAALALLAAYGAGALYGCALLFARRAKLADELRFGPFLAFGTLAGTFALSFDIGVPLS